MMPGSETFNVTVNICILPSWLRTWQLQLSHPLSCWVLISLFGFSVVHFPRLKVVFFHLGSEMVSPSCYAISCAALGSRRQVNVLRWVSCELFSCRDSPRPPLQLPGSGWGDSAKVPHHHTAAWTIHRLMLSPPEMHQQPPPFLQSIFLCNIPEYDCVFILVQKFLLMQWCRCSIHFGDTLLFI